MGEVDIHGEDKLVVCVFYVVCCSWRPLVPPVRDRFQGHGGDISPEELASRGRGVTLVVARDFLWTCETRPLAAPKFISFTPIVYIAFR